MENIAYTMSNNIADEIRDKAWSKFKKNLAGIMFCLISGMMLG